jgi:hypothetical protein
LILFSTESGQTYLVALKNASFRRESGKEDRWDMSISFFVAQKV